MLRSDGWDFLGLEEFCWATQGLFVEGRIVESSLLVDVEFLGELYAEGFEYFEEHGLIDGSRIRVG